MGTPIYYFRDHNMNTKYCLAKTLNGGYTKYKLKRKNEISELNDYPISRYTEQSNGRK